MNIFIWFIKFKIIKYINLKLSFSWGLGIGYCGLGIG